MPFDMHMHSTASDGRVAPELLPQLVKDAGLVGFSLTDHDTVAGIGRAAAAAKELDLAFIPGIEISCEANDHDIHVLGYWFDAAKMQADGRLQLLAEARVQRVEAIAHRLELLGMPVDIEAILAKGTECTLGRPHVAAAMVEKGYVSTPREAFIKWLGRGLPAFVPRYKLTVEESVEMIKGAGGVAVLAHPGPSDADFLLPKLNRLGFGGLECYHSDHHKEAERRYAHFARQHRLAVLGGSDFHHLGARPIGCRRTMLAQLEWLARYLPADRKPVLPREE
ncbi:MAG: PHP domain-containing protein [Firmicutes bacterium]|nr:PHP domain-containing protein [Bacillota bacterium]